MSEEIHRLAYLAYDRYEDLLDVITKNDSLRIRDLVNFDTFKFYTYFDSDTEFNLDYNKRYNAEISYLSKLGINQITEEISNSITGKIKEDILHDYQEKLNLSIKLLSECGLVEIENQIKVKVTEIFYEIKAYKEYEDNEYMDRFINNLSIILDKVTQKQLDYVNRLINITGKRADENNNKDKVAISIQNLQKIKYIAITIQELENNKITSTNYGTKVNGFNTYIATALTKHNMIMNTTIPFSQPSDLYIEIDKILTKAELTKEHKKNFFQYFLTKERLPKQEHIINTLNKHAESKIHELNHNELSAFYNEEEDFKYSSDALELIKYYSEKDGKSEIDGEAEIHKYLYYEYHDNSDRAAYEEDMLEQKVRREAKINNFILSYPFEDNIANMFTDSKSTDKLKSLYKELF